MTSHIQTLRMLIFQDLTDTSSTLFIPSLAIRPDFACVPTTSIEYTLAFCYHLTRLRHIVDAQLFFILPSSPPFQPNK
jgi:hypothetical protein